LFKFKGHQVRGDYIPFVIPEEPTEDNCVQAHWAMKKMSAATPPLFVEGLSVWKKVYDASWHKCMMQDGGVFSEKDASTYCFWVIMDKETKWAGKCEKIVTNFLKLEPGVGLRKDEEKLEGVEGSTLVIGDSAHIMSTYR